MHPIIQRLNIFKPLAPDLEARLVTSFTLAQVRQKQFLVQVGEIPKHLYFIEKGSFFVYSKAAEEISVSSYRREGEPVVKFEDFFYALPSEEDIICFEDSVVYILTYDEAKMILNDFPDFESYLYQMWGKPMQVPDSPIPIYKRRLNMAMALIARYVKQVADSFRYIFDPVLQFKIGLRKRLNR
jgi:signal-transduction protein with cAMP-binding, CBS, and nucleotidyltransferase domain